MLRIPTCILATALFTISVTTTHAADLFPDKGLDAAVRKSVFEKRNNNEPLTKDDVKDISVIHGSGAEIKSLEGLQHCLAVQEIRLADNEISDLSPIAELKQLQSLTLSGNQISDITPLAGLTKLQYLNLEGNQVSKLAPLAKLTAMRSLYLSDNKIQRLGALRGMTKMWSLYLGGNPIKSAKVLQHLSFVDTLDLSGCGLSSADIVKPMKRLRTVYLMNNKLSDLSTFVDMLDADKGPRLMQLYVEGNPLDATKIETQIEMLRKKGARVHLGEKNKKSDQDK
ncbi:MAG: hypothetical protein Aurels2KO_02670 [Aureliella sp.]